MIEITRGPLIVKKGEKSIELDDTEAYQLWLELNKQFKAVEVVPYIPYYPYPCCPCPKEPDPGETTYISIIKCDNTECNNKNDLTDPIL